jgi:hypothetical protein
LIANDQHNPDSDPLVPSSVAKNALKSIFFSRQAAQVDQESFKIVLHKIIYLAIKAYS